MPGKELFYTRDAAEKGTRLDLVDKLGRPTQHWLRIRHVLSDEYRRAIVDQGRRHFQEISGIEDPSKRRAAEEDSKRTALAALVIAWSFEDAPTLEAIKDLLYQAPQLADLIARSANDSDLFFEPESEISSTSPASTSGLTDDQKEASAPSDSSTARSGSSEG
jgi:hypothetical protein